MGEVFLAHDTAKERKVALKCMRRDKKQTKFLVKKFLNEGLLTCRLTHPHIVPIYDLCDDVSPESKDGFLYYTMPYIDGKSLRDRLEEARISQNVSQGQISALIPAFVSVCQAAAYAHAHKILHLDLKPHNVMLGSYGEVFLVDWGIAQHFDTIEEKDLPLDVLEERELSPKVAGTIAYVHPANLLGKPPSIQSDIYSLGMMLYEILTLKLPVTKKLCKTVYRATRRHTDPSSFITEFHCRLFEQIPTPSEAAPWREVPRALEKIALKALCPDDPYKNVEEMLDALGAFTQGRAEWFFLRELHIEKNDDWELSQLLLLSPSLSLNTDNADADWASLMLSFDELTQSFRVRFDITITQPSQGIGIILGSAEKEAEHDLTAGKFLWLGAKASRTSCLYRSNVPLVDISHVGFTPTVQHSVEIQREVTVLRLFIDGQLVLSYVEQRPDVHPRFGLLLRDQLFTLSSIRLDVASLSIRTSCLAVPDALMATGAFDASLKEYRRIGWSFPGRKEGREALFRAGICLLEKAKKERGFKKRQKAFGAALDEFSALHDTPGAPLEYLGKALVYQALNDVEEEINCLELGARRYSDHPLIDALYEQILARLHSYSARKHKASLRLLLLLHCVLPQLLLRSDVLTLAARMEKDLEALPFFFQPYGAFDDIDRRVLLCFWLNTQQPIVDVFPKLLEKDSFESLHNAVIALLAINAKKEAKDLLTLWSAAPKYLFQLLEGKPLKNPSPQAALFFSYQCLAKKRYEHVQGPPDISCWVYQAQGLWEKANAILDENNATLRSKDGFWAFLRFCQIAKNEGREKAEEALASLPMTSTPRHGMLFLYFILGHFGPHDIWEKRSFAWQHLQLKLQKEHYTYHE